MNTRFGSGWSDISDVPTELEQIALIEQAIAGGGGGGGGGPLPSDVAYTDVVQTFTEAQTFGNATVTGTLTLGTRLGHAALPTDVAYKDETNTFTQAQTFGNATVTGTLTLDNRLGPTALPTDVAYTDVANTFTVAQTIDADALVTGALTAAVLIPSGLAGSTAATREVGGTTSGAPTSGAHETGDVVVAHDGDMWVCTSAGTPGVWAQLLGSAFYEPWVDVGGNLVIEQDGSPVMVLVSST